MVLRVRIFMMLGNLIGLDLEGCHRLCGGSAGIFLMTRLVRVMRYWAVLLPKSR